jgi:catechol 2,3-dioxygenase-like lactoylglutathione lyase family enzyme
MTIQRMDNVAIVVEDLDAAVAFFAELGGTVRQRFPAVLPARPGRHHRRLGRTDRLTRAD